MGEVRYIKKQGDLGNETSCGAEPPSMKAMLEFAEDLCAFESPESTPKQNAKVCSLKSLAVAKSPEKGRQKP